MPSFGLVTEGPSDQVVIENILYGVFKDDPDLPITRLQPAPDEPGNWDKVFKYCRSDEFKSAFGFNDYLIIQVDTDVLVGGEIPKAYGFQFPPNPTPEALIEKVTDFLISLIGNENDFWEQYREKIIFAISVNQIECWFLPIYFKDRKDKRGKTSGCISTLNEVLNEREGFYIKGKDLGYYTKISKHFKKNIHQYFPLNPSLKVFVENLLEVKHQKENPPSIDEV